MKNTSKRQKLRIDFIQQQRTKERELGLVSLFGVEKEKVVDTGEPVYTLNGKCLTLGQMTELQRLELRGFDAALNALLPEDETAC